MELQAATLNSTNQGTQNPNMVNKGITLIPVRNEKNTLKVSGNPSVITQDYLNSNPTRVASHENDKETNPYLRTLQKKSPTNQRTNLSSNQKNQRTTALLEQSPRSYPYQVIIESADGLVSQQSNQGIASEQMTTREIPTQKAKVTTSTQRKKTNNFDPARFKLPAPQPKKFFNPSRFVFPATEKSVLAAKKSFYHNKVTHYIT